MTSHQALTIWYFLAESTSVEPGERSFHWVGNFYAATLTDATAATAATGLVFSREIDLYFARANVFRSENRLSVSLVGCVFQT